MINSQMRNYDYYIYGEQDAYGQPTLSDKKGTVKMAINVLSKRIEDNVLYTRHIPTGRWLNLQCWLNWWRSGT